MNEKMNSDQNPFEDKNEYIIFISEFTPKHDSSALSDTVKLPQNSPKINAAEKMSSNLFFLITPTAFLYVIGKISSDI